MSCVSKNVKFRLFRNSTKFDVVAKFRERISMVKSVCHPRSKKFLGFSLYYFDKITVLLFFRKNEIFSGFTFHGS